MFRITFAMALTCFSSMAFAGSFRCQGTIVKPGMKAEEVRILCGDPASQRSFVTTIKLTENETEVHRYLQDEVWVFDLGSSVKLKTVHFRDDLVTDVKTSKYVGKIAKNQLDCSGDKPPFKTGASMDVVNYLCGEPAARRLAETSFLKTPTGETEIKTENWHYGTGDATMLYSFQGQKLRSVTRRF